MYLKDSVETPGHKKLRIVNLFRISTFSHCLSSAKNAGRCILCLETEPHLHSCTLGGLLQSIDLSELDLLQFTHLFGQVVNLKLHLLVVSHEILSEKGLGLQTSLQF